MITKRQILPEKKIADGKPTSLVFPFINDADQRMIIEYNVLKRINQTNQFYEEKKECKYYRFYGNVNQLVNLKYPKNVDFVTELTFENFDITNEENWYSYLMAPLANEDGSKGDKKITITYEDEVRTLDFNRGLPALVVKTETIGNRTRKGLLLYVGHNFQVNDILLLVKTKNDSRYANGYYKVVYVKGNKIYIQFIKKLPLSFTTAVIEEELNTTEGGGDNEMMIIGDDEIELGITIEEYQATLPPYPAGSTAPYTNWLAILNPSIFIKKVVNDVQSEYYLKKLKVLGKVNEFFYNSFANNYYGQKTALYTIPKKVTFEDKKTNLKEPITDIYLSFIKKEVDINMSNVYSTFSNFVTSTFEGGGLQNVSDVNYITDGAFLYHSLVEYNTETLLEIEINKVEHTFLTNITDNPVRFSYDPFTDITIRKYSNTIDEHDTNDSIPDYATYSTKYQKYRWRNLLDIGFYEESLNGIDFPYLNDSFYVYSDALLHIRNHKSIKQSSILSGGYLISTYTDNLAPYLEPDPPNTTGSEFLDDILLYENLNDKPFEEYEKIC